MHQNKQNLLPEPLLILIIGAKIVFEQKNCTLLRIEQNLNMENGIKTTNLNYF